MFIAHDASLVPQRLYECIDSYDSDVVCRGGLWHFVTLVDYFATVKAELGAVLAAHFNYTDSGVVKLCGA